MIYIIYMCFYLKIYRYIKEQQQKKPWKSLQSKIGMGFWMQYLWEKEKFLIFWCFSRLLLFIYLVFCRVGRRGGLTKYKKLLLPWIYFPFIFFLWCHLVWWEVATWWGQALFLRTTLSPSGIRFKHSRSISFKSCHSQPVRSLQENSGFGVTKKYSWGFVYCLVQT